MDELEKKETQRRKGAEIEEGEVAAAHEVGWRPLLASLAMFSDDFMAEREQPLVQERETLEP